jgi:hypothetical protein
VRTNKGRDPRVVVWFLAGLIVICAVFFAVVTVTLPGCTYCQRAALSPDCGRSHAK